LYITNHQKKLFMKIAIIIGSTRPNRNGESVAGWVYEKSIARKDAEFELVDLKSFNLPLLDEPMPASFGQYTHEHTKIWAQKIASFDSFIFVTPEYNRSTSGALKNAIDYLFHEWKNKTAGFVGYGSLGGAHAISHLRGIMAELGIADVRTQVSLSLSQDFENYSIFKPASFHEKNLNQMLNELISSGNALKALRQEKAKSIG
jgi:NAD(P)H-dependent FMN reductase